MINYNRFYLTHSNISLTGFLHIIFPQTSLHLSEHLRFIKKNSTTGFSEDANQLTDSIY